MKLARYYLEQIDGVEIFPLVAFFIFFIFFIIIGIRVIRMDKGFINKMSHIPLSEDQDEQSTLKKKKVI